MLIIALPVLPWLGFWVLLFLFFLLLSNLLVFRSLHSAAPPANPPLISVLIPARNEARNIERCLRSILDQDYPRLEIIVLDDQSSDGTSEFVRALLAAHPRGSCGRLISGTPLPDGWTGKNWACHQLSEAAAGEYLFFIDADTFHRPGTLAAALDFSREHRADLLSAWPRMINRTLGEKLIVPVICLVGLVFWAHWVILFFQRFPALARRVSPEFLRTFGGANGQFMFFRRDAYQRIGGHHTVRNSVVDDVALGRLVASKTGEGLRVRNCDAVDFSEVRMYRSFRESWLGFAKNIRAVFEQHEVLFWLFILALWSCFLAPFIRWFWAPPEQRPLLLAEISLIAAIRLILTIRLRLTWIGALLHPLGIALFIGVCLHSEWLSKLRQVPWKGRAYTVKA